MDHQSFKLNKPEHINVEDYSKDEEVYYDEEEEEIEIDQNDINFTNGEKGEEELQWQNNEEEDIGHGFETQRTMGDGF